MINNINLNSISGAIIPYTPPKSAEEFVNGEVVKKAHEIFEEAIHFHLKECKLLKVPNDDLLKWRYLTNTNPISESQDFFSILKDQKMLPLLFSFLDRNSLQNLTLCAKNVKENVDQYVEQGFEHYFGMSCEKFQESVDDYNFTELNNLLIKAIKKDVPEIVIEKFISILLPTTDQIEFEDILYPPLQKAIENHASADTILAFLRATTRFGQICNEDDPTGLIELALEERIATKEIIEALLNAGSGLDTGPACTINVALKHGASKEIIEALVNAGAKLDTGPDCTIYKALEYGASAEVIKTLLQAGASIGDEEDPLVTIDEAIDFKASAEVIQLLLEAGVEVWIGSGPIPTFIIEKMDSFAPVLDQERKALKIALENGASFEPIPIVERVKTLLAIDIANIQWSLSSTSNYARKAGASPEVIQLIEIAQMNALICMLLS